MNSMGLAVMSCSKPCRSRSASGSRHNRNSRTLVHRLSQNFFIRSVILAEIHSRIEARHLIVSVEHPCLDVLAEYAGPQPLFGSLAVGRMIHLGIHIRVEAVS